MHMGIIPTAVPAQTTNGMEPTASFLTIYPPVVVLPVPIMVPAIPTVPIISIVTVLRVTMGNNANMFKQVRVLHNPVKMVVRVMIWVWVIVVTVKTVTMVLLVSTE